MAITNRVKRLLCADVHAVLDVIEEPEAILKQAIREMQEALDWKKARLTGNEKTLLSLQANQAYLEEELVKIGKDLELALEEGAEDLSRKILGRRLITEKHLDVMAKRIEQWQILCRQRTEEIETQESQLASILEKSKMFVHPSTDDSPFRPVPVSEICGFPVGIQPPTDAGFTRAYGQGRGRRRIRRRNRRSWPATPPAARGAPVPPRQIPPPVPVRRHRDCSC